MYATLKVSGEMAFLEGVPTSDQIHEAVGGWFEVIEIPGLGDMWLNEEGKLDGLAKNEKATWITQEGPKGSAGLMHGDYIAGDVVFTGGSDDEGETVGLSDESVAWLREFDATKRVITFGATGAKMV